MKTLLLIALAVFARCLAAQTQSASYAEDGFDRTGGAKFAEDGYDRTQAHRFS